MAGVQKSDLPKAKFRIWEITKGSKTVKPITDGSFKNARIIATSPNRPNEIVSLLEKEKPTESGLFLVDLNNRKSKKFAAKENYSAWYLDHNFKLRAATRRESLYDNRVSRKTADGSWKQIVPNSENAVNKTGRHLSSVVHLSSDGKTVFVVNNYGRDKAVFEIC